LTARDESQLRGAGATAALLKAARDNYRVPVLTVRAPSLPVPATINADPLLLPPKPSGGISPADRAAHPDTFTATEVTRKAVIIFKPEPDFTEEARKNSVSGTVVLRARLDVSGKVMNVTVVKGLPDGLSEKAVAAARQIRFIPAQKDGRDVSQWVLIEYNFGIY
jgi:TonB family protein